jgi:uncharacterized protein (TIGR00299 family) protein
VILWLNPFCGLSGDMWLGAILDLGASLEGIRRVVATTLASGWSLEAERVDRGGLVATRAVVSVEDSAKERTARELWERAKQARPGPVAMVASRAIAALARVEGELHGEDPDEVHLHELGGLDTLVDVVAVAAGLDLLHVTEVRSAPIALGSGTVETSHGVLPAPAPATLALLRGAHVVGAGDTGETVTPTGAALLGALGTVFAPFPPMVVEAAGYGAGSRTLPDRPNVLQAMLGEPLGVPLGSTTTNVLLETNVDDATGEVLGHVMSAALDAGAADAWATPAVMKKGRPAHVVHILSEPSAASRLEALLLRETGSLGLRRSFVDKLMLPRETVTVDVDGHPVRVKRGPWGLKAEYDDAAAAARALGVPLRHVATRAQQLADTS